MGAAFAAMFTSLASLGFEVDLRTARIETSTTNESQGLAVQELEKHLALMVGGRIASSEGSAVFVVGKVAPGCAAAAEHEARAHAVGGRIYFWGDDSGKRSLQRWGTLFAVYGFIEKVLGVRWVEPGDRGIVFKKRAKVDVPDGWNYRFYPPLDITLVRASRDGHGWLAENDEAPVALRISEARAKALSLDWAQWMLRLRHQMRKRFWYGHAFTFWNKRFVDTRPELLAMDEKGVRGLPGVTDYNRAKRVMLCISNPAVADQIIADWMKGGTNEYMNVCPNDSTSFCRCPSCCAWDADLPWEDFKANKADRYVHFWNILIDKARAIRPDVKVVSYLYASYRFPPRRERIASPDNFLGGIVPSIEEDSEELIGGWRKMGLKHYFVRPNYLCYTATPVRGLERFFCEDFKRNLAGGMIGIDEDNYPRAPTQFEFYTLGRLAAEPDLPFEEIEAEYLSQYGSAAPEMKEYFARARARGEAGRRKAVERSRRKRNGELKSALDDSNLYGTVYSAHVDSDYAGDLEVVGRALAHSDLSEIERWRVNRVRALIENARLTRKFIYARDSMERPDFAKIGRELVLKRIELKDAIDDNWGRVFRGYPAEVRWWMCIKKKYLREFWDSPSPGR